MPEENLKPQKTLLPSKRGRKPSSGKKFKVTKFDKALVKLIQSGVTLFSDWCRTLGVDEIQARVRVQALVEKGYLAPDAQLVGVYRLGIEGYNKYGSLKIKPAAKETGVAASQKTAASAVPASSTSSSLPPVASFPSPALPSSLPSRPAVPAPLPFGGPTETIPKARSGMDLAEMLAKGAPGGRMLKKDGSMCELCRGVFKVSLKEPKLAKFAHCVCGSAYHSDCHQSLIDGGAGCVRCGRKLATVLDQNSQDALKFLKDAFE